MTHDDRLAEAVKVVRAFKSGYVPVEEINILLSLAETYLSQGEGWPEPRKCEGCGLQVSESDFKEFERPHDCCPDGCPSDKAFNEAIKLCKLASLRDLDRERQRVMAAVSVEKITYFLERNQLVQRFIIEHDKDLPTVSMVDLLATALHAMIREAVEGEGRKDK